MTTVHSEGLRLAFLPIGGHFTIGPREAALAAGLLDVEDVLPIHCETFQILTGTPAELRSALDERGLAMSGSTRPSRARASQSVDGVRV